MTAGTSPAGRALLLTGAASGLGADLARGLAAAGYPVVGVARSQSALERVASEIASAGGAFVPVTGDVRDADTVGAAVAAAQALGDGLYGVIANAGVAGPTANLQDISDEEWEETFAVNVTSVFRLCRAAVPPLLARREGRIVIVGSVTGKRPLPGRTPYAASKLALVGLARSLATELGPSGTTVNVVSPWLLDGPRLEAVCDAQAQLRQVPCDTVREELLSSTVTHSTTSTDDVLATVEYLLSPRNRNITGQDINVSGGAVMY